MGCGLMNSDVLKIGVFATPEELFDQRRYDHARYTNAKRVRNYYTYYSTRNLEPIGFSKGSRIYLYTEDVHDRSDETKLSARTTPNDNSLFRCGAYSYTYLCRSGPCQSSAVNIFRSSYKIVFYYRT